ncbi:MAG: hypothetical protein JSR33_09030 [Proteobacteria bacterium]|nr:hypothetical protein [Pseudomonadota bacterium]
MSKHGFMDGWQAKKKGYQPSKEKPVASDQKDGHQPIKNKDPKAEPSPPKAE